jgi:hypothetical protein
MELVKGILNGYAIDEWISEMLSKEDVSLTDNSWFEHIVRLYVFNSLHLQEIGEAASKIVDSLEIAQIISNSAKKRFDEVDVLFQLDEQLKKIITQARDIEKNYSSEPPPLGKVLMAGMVEELLRNGRLGDGSSLKVYQCYNAVVELFCEMNRAKALGNKKPYSYRYIEKIHLNVRRREEAIHLERFHLGPTVFAVYLQQLLWPNSPEMNALIKR